MDVFKNILNESITITGVPVVPSKIDNYINFFFNTISKVSKSYKKKSSDYMNQYETLYYGKIFDPETNIKIINQRPHYNLTRQVLKHYNKIFYILQLDVDSSNVITMYKEYKDKSKYEKYALIIKAKNNILQLLKKSGFNVKYDRTYIYASITDYIKNPDENNGYIKLNLYQKKLIDTAKKYFIYDGVFSGYNQYSVTLQNVTTLKNIEEIEKNSYFDKIIMSTNGKIDFYKYNIDVDSPVATINLLLNI